MDWIFYFIVINDRMITIIQSNNPFKDIFVKNFRSNDSLTTLSSRTISKSFFQVIHPNLNRSSKAHFIEIIYSGYPHSKSKSFEASKWSEHLELIKKGTRKFVLKEEVPVDATILGSGFVFTIKDEGTEIWKVWFEVQDYKDEIENFLVHDIATIKNQHTILLI